MNATQDEVWRLHIRNLSIEAAPGRVLFAAKNRRAHHLRRSYDRYPALKARWDLFTFARYKEQVRSPESHYEHIPGSKHEKDWQKDLATPERDAFFVCRNRDDWQGRWLGKSRP